MKVFVARPVRNSNPFETKIVEFLETHKELSDTFVAHIIESRPAFEKAVAELTEEQVEAIDVLLNSTSADVWYEFSKKIDWVNDAIQFMGRSIDWYVEQDFYGVGKGKFPVNGAVELVNDASPLKTARMLVQNSISDQRRRTRDELQYFLYLVGTATDTKMRRVLSIVANKSIVDAHEYATAAKARVEKALSENEAQNKPEWQRHLLSPGTFKCQCDLCAVKFVRGPRGLVEFISETDEDDMQEMAMAWITRYVTNIHLAELAAQDGVSLENRVKVQADALANMGSPFFLTREDMRQIVENDDLWTRFSSWGENEHEILIRNKAYHGLGESVLSSRRELPAPAFNAVMLLTELRAKFEYYLAHPDVPRPKDVLTELKEKTMRLLDENDAGLREFGYPVDMFRAIFSKL